MATTAGAAGTACAIRSVLNACGSQVTMRRTPSSVNVATSALAMTLGRTPPRSSGARRTTAPSRRRGGNRPSRCLRPIRAMGTPARLRPSRRACRPAGPRDCSALRRRSNTGAELARELAVDHDALAQAHEAPGGARARWDRPLRNSRRWCRTTASRRRRRAAPWSSAGRRRDTAHWTTLPVSASGLIRSRGGPSHSWRHGDRPARLTP